MLLDLIGVPLAGVLATPAMTFAVECLLGASASIDERRIPRTSRRYVVLVPAHDESAGIARTLAGLAKAVGSTGEVLVIADNCSDDTAAIARRAGVRVLERTDTVRRGKGYALMAGVEAVADDPPEVIVVVDADCEVEPHALDLLVEAAAGTGRPAQGDYVFEPADDGLKSKLSAFAVRVRNRVRPLGASRLSMPCPLFGTGMAFPYELVKRIGFGGGHITEDILLAVSAASEGRPPIFVPEAHVVGTLPVGDEAAKGQRTRWEHGHLSLIREQVPGLLAHAIVRRDLAALGLALDLAVPPLAFLVGTLGGVFIVLVGSGLFLLAPVTTAITGLSLGAVGIAVLAARSTHASDLVSLRDLAAVPRYIAWKLPLYTRFFQGREEKSWVRTARDGDPAKPAPG